MKKIALLIAFLGAPALGQEPYPIVPVPAPPPPQSGTAHMNCSIVTSSGEKTSAQIRLEFGKDFRFPDAQLISSDESILPSMPLSRSTGRMGYLVRFASIELPDGRWQTLKFNPPSTASYRETIEVAQHEGRITEWGFGINTVFAAGICDLQFENTP